MTLHKTLIWCLTLLLTCAAQPAAMEAGAAEEAPQFPGSGHGSPPAATSPAPVGCPAEADASSAPPPEADIREMKARYRHDPTGVRARLGMCRRQHDGSGGPHRRFHGGRPWQEP